MAVLRMSGSTINKNWNIWQMQDVNGNEQLAVRLNGESRSVEFSFTALDSRRQTVVFGPLDFLFNERWHQVLLDVSKRSVTLAVDCVAVGSEKTPPRQKVSLDGFTLIGKSKDNPLLAVPVRFFLNDPECNIENLSWKVQTISEPTNYLCICYYYYY